MAKTVDISDLRKKVVADLIATRFAGKQKDFAEAIEVDSTTVSRWFMTSKGRKNIGEEVARRIELHLKLPSGSVVMGGGAASQDSQVLSPESASDALTDEELQILRIFRGLQKASRSKAISYFEGLRDGAKDKDTSAERKLA